MGSNFAFFLPIMMASFGCTFLIVWRWGAAARWWSGGFFCVAAGFTAPLAAHILPLPIWAYLADLVFATGFLCFSQALMARWRPNWLLGLRLSIWAMSIAGCWWAIAAGELPAELCASDVGCFLLISLPLVAARGNFRRWPDYALFIATLLVSLDNLGRASTIWLTLGQSGFLSSDYAYLMQALASMFGLFLALAALGSIVDDLLARYVEDALVDPLSGLLNRRGFDTRLAELGQRGEQGSVVICDIDHFKQVNDMHGHAEGDRVIVTLADTLRAMAPKKALIARFGGEEFVLFLPETPLARASALANDVRRAFSDEAAPQLGLGRVLTASFGISARQAGDISIHDAIDRADLALYEAKSRGRDRVCVQRAWEGAEQAEPLLKRIA